MDYEKYKILFTKKAKDNGYSQENLDKCLEYAFTLLTRKLPVIYNTSHLAALVGYKRSYIKKSIYYPRAYYRSFQIKKANGKKRSISEPLPSLKEIQLWILENILYKRSNSRYAKAYIPNRTIVDYVKYHVDQPILLCVDICDFFPSIKLPSIIDIFKNFGYCSRVAEVLAKLCCLDNCLPQGASTSPQLSNIYMHFFDKKLALYCKNKNIKFTRYADDMAFSGNFDINELLIEVAAELDVIGLKLNNSKTRVMTPNMRQEIAGIIVNKKIQSPKEKRKEVRQILYYIKKYGLEDHLIKINCSRSNYLKHLLGVVNYYLFLNPLDNELNEYKSYLVDLYKQNNGKQLTH